MTLTVLIPSQSARSRALARAVDRPTTRTPRSVWDEMKFVRDTITSSTGPRSFPEMKCHKLTSHVLLVFKVQQWFTVKH